MAQCLLAYLALASLASVNALPSDLGDPALGRRQTNDSVETGESTANQPKAGLAWANGGSVDITQFAATGKVNWYYTWSVWPVTTGWRRRPVEMEFVPMLWGGRSVGDFEDRIEDVVEQAEDAGYPVKVILGMNEPEQPGQANMSPEDGAEMWIRHLEPLRERFSVQLGSPAVSSAPSGKVWLEDFFTACDGRCTVDFIVLHWYGTNPEHFITHLYDYHHTFLNASISNGTLWVTEWACHNFVDLSPAAQCTSEQVASFMERTQAFMDETEWVEKYAWFGAMRDLQGVDEDNALMDGDGEISELGRQYINATGDQPLGGGGGNRAVGMRESWTRGFIVTSVFIVHLLRSVL